MASTLVVLAHPHLQRSRIHRKMLDALQRDAPGSVAVRDLYALYPDYLIDVPAEQAALEAARLVVWLHPVHWYGMPPLMKLWADEVLDFGWAYGPGGTTLRGKDLWLVTSTGGSAEAYQPAGSNRYFFDAFLPPYDQTAALCGMRFLPPLVLHGAHRVSEAELASHVATFVDRLARYPDWPELEELDSCDMPQLEPTDRPAEEVDRNPA